MAGGGGNAIATVAGCCSLKMMANGRATDCEFEIVSYLFA